MSLYGTVNDDSLAGMLWQIYAQGKTGVLEAFHGDQRVKIYIKHGAVIHAVGYQKEALLGYLLQHNNLISAEQLKSGLTKSKSQKIALGKVLVDDKIIDVHTLGEIIRRQAEMIFSNLYSWQEGGYEFRGSNIKESNIVPVKLNLMELAVSAARSLEAGDVFTRFIDDPRAILKTRQDGAELVLPLSDLELKILGVIDGEKSLDEIRTAGAHESNDFYRAVFILILCGKLVSIFGEASVKSAARAEINSEEANALKTEILDNLHELPPLLHTALRAQQILADPMASFKDVSSIIEEDQAMAVRILKVANSAYYGLVGQVSSVQHASVVLGHKTLSEIITAASASDYLVKVLDGYDQDAETLWRHSLAVALGGKLLASKRRPRLEGDAFTVGLFHDIGKVVLDPYIKEQKETFVETRKQYGQDTTEAERQLFGFDHAELAADLCQQWNLPETLGLAIKYHHFPEDSENNDLAHIVHVANCWAHKLALDEDADEDPMANIEEETYRALGLDEAGLVDIMSPLADSWESLAKTMR